MELGEKPFLADKVLVIRIVMEISVCSLQFQTVTICHGFITFLF